MAHWEGYQLEGLKKKRKKKKHQILYSILAYLLPEKRGKMAPVRGHLNSTPFYSSVYIANAKVNTRRFPMSRPVWPSTRILKKRENVSLKTLIKSLSKSFWQGLKHKIPLTFP